MCITVQLIHWQASQLQDGDEEEMEDEVEESGEEHDDETDEYESTSPGALAAIFAGGQEVE